MESVLVAEGLGGNTATLPPSMASRSRSTRARCIALIGPKAGKPPDAATCGDSSMG